MLNIFLVMPSNQHQQSNQLSVGRCYERSTKWRESPLWETLKTLPERWNEKFRRRAQVVTFRKYFTAMSLNVLAHQWQKQFGKKCSPSTEQKHSVLTAEPVDNPPKYFHWTKWELEKSYFHTTFQCHRITLVVDMCIVDQMWSNLIWTNGTL